MFSLLAAVAICFLVPWLPILFLRYSPVRPGAPLSPDELEYLASRVRPQPARASTPRPQTIAPPHKESPSAAPEKPAPAGPTVEEPPALALRPYQWVNWFVIPVFLVSMLGLMAAWSLALHYLAEQHARTFPPARYLFYPRPYGIIFAVPGLFLGIFSSVVIIDPFTRLILGRRRYIEYSHWEQARRGLEGQEGMQAVGRFFVVFADILGLVMAVWVVLSMNWYLRLTDDIVAVKPLFGLDERTYSYADVTQVVWTRRARIGKKVVDRDDVYLRFRDGSTWTTVQSFRVPDSPAERTRLLDFLHERTGREPIRAESIEFVPGW